VIRLHATPGGLLLEQQDVYRPAPDDFSLDGLFRSADPVALAHAALAAAGAPVPPPTLALNVAGRIFGYTIGNDMSSRDIEGENPLYLPQAKVYDGCAALGPCLVVTADLPGADTPIRLEILRAGQTVFTGETQVGRIRRPLPSLADWLFRENRFPAGAYLMTGTGIVPPDAFTLHSGDEVRISLPPVGTLRNPVA